MRNYWDYGYTCNPHDNYMLITGRTLQHRDSPHFLCGKHLQCIYLREAKSLLSKYIYTVFERLFSGLKVL